MAASLVYGLIGEHLSHSFSPEIHAAIGAFRGEYPYTLCELAPADLPAFLRAKAFEAINVTIPYKEAVIPYLDEISPRAAAIGAVNTVVRRGDHLYGDNTDYAGMAAMLACAGISLAGQKVLILGTGGTSRTAMALARDAGASAVLRVSRSGKEGAITYESACRDHADAGVILNTTPVGMYPFPGKCPIDLAAFPALVGVGDVIFNPLRTTLVQNAALRGIPAVGGLRMLIAQAVAAAERFFDSPLPQSLIDAIDKKMLAEKENIVLIGMPSCGKTTVGRLLAEHTGRPFYDTDRLIEERTGQSPAALIAARGIEAFRAVECEAVARLAPESGVVIATGGGTLLIPENRRALCQNGRLFFLDRPLALLTPTDDRPLSSSREALAARYAERRPLYLSSAEEIIDASGTPADCAQEIEKRMHL